MTTIAQRLAQAEGAMRTSRNPPVTPEDAERGRVIQFMVDHNFKEWPEGADPALVARVIDLNNRV